MLDRFVTHVRSRQLIASTDRVLVGYSGGPDSTCLVHLMHKAGFDIVAAHLHHGQRLEADVEAKLCEAFCTEQGIPFVTGRADVPTMAYQMKIGLEEAGRHARYEFFRQAAFRLGCSSIATAHTLDDHVETVLLNLTRGAGMSGLTGIPERRDQVIRPLLAFARSEARDYCLSRGLWTHDDPANTDISFSRARIRHRVLPELECINPDVNQAIARMASLIDEEDAYLDAHAIRSMNVAEIPLNGNLRFVTVNQEVAFARQQLTQVSPVLLRRALRMIVSALGGSLDHAKVMSIFSALNFYPGSFTAEGGNVAIEWSEERLHIRQVAIDEPFRFPLTVPGATDSDTFGWTIEAFPTEINHETFPRDSLDVVLDQSKTKGPLFLRSCETGDRVAPLGFDKPRKVSDLLGEAKLTLAARKRLPIICDILGVVWVPGICLADRVKTVGKTSHGLRLRFGPPATGAVDSS